MEGQVSIVEYFYDKYGKQGSRCGYCKSSDTNISQGMWGHKVTCQDYEDLIDRGWRRSGKYLYKPTMNKTCCPMYTIRCDAIEFKPSKSHKKLLKKVAKFLNDTPSEATEETQEKKEEQSAPQDSRDTDDVKKHQSKVQAENKSVGADPNKPRCRKAKEIRMERKHQKLAARGVEQVPKQPKEIKGQEGKTLEELIATHLPTDQSTHRLERVLLKCNADSAEFQKTYQQSFELFCKYQREIHKDKAERLNEKRIKLVKADMENDDFLRTFKESCSVFAKYQINIHHDRPGECDRNQFEKHSSTPTSGWGSFHEQFFLDGKLIGVGVLDILPHCVSSVYFYYDTDYSFLSPGVYSALRELYLTRELNKSCSDLRYYYMGFYVHSCPKMKYKSQYSPSYLACPETYSWIPVEKCIPKLDAKKYSRLDDTNKEDAIVDIETVRILDAREKRLMNYRTYKARCKIRRDEQDVKEYAQLVGPLVAPRMAFYKC